MLSFSLVGASIWMVCGKVYCLFIWFSKSDIEKNMYYGKSGLYVQIMGIMIMINLKNNWEGLMQSNKE